MEETHARVKCWLGWRTKPLLNNWIPERRHAGWGRRIDVIVGISTLLNSGGTVFHVSRSSAVCISCIFNCFSERDPNWPDCLEIYMNDFEAKQLPTLYNCTLAIFIRILFLSADFCFYFLLIPNYVKFV